MAGNTSVRATNRSMTGNDQPAGGEGPAKGPDGHETSCARGAAHAHDSVAARMAISTESAEDNVNRRMASAAATIAQFDAKFSGRQLPPSDGMMADLDQLLHETQSSRN